MRDERQLWNRRAGDLVIRGRNREFLGISVRDVVAPVFRQRRTASMIFLGIFMGAVLSGLLMPRKYESEMKILVNRDRLDAAVTPNAEGPLAMGQIAPVSEEDMNSEVELLKSRDLLEQVVLECRLADEKLPGWERKLRNSIDFVRGVKPSQATELARAVDTLDNRLIVDPLKKTAVIRVSYASRAPELSARVLNALAKLYKEKHAAVHRPTGTYRFFDLETEQYRNELADYKARLTEFSTRTGLLDTPVQKQLLLQQISEFQTELDQDRASAYAAQHRALKLKQQESESPERQTTLVRKTDNGELLAQLHSTLLSLELKRSDLITRYAPEYPLVTELDSQIADAESAIVAAEKAPIEEVTTDRTPTQDWMATELSKAEADQTALDAKAGAVERVLRQYQEAARRLETAGAAQDDLIRDAKTAEDNYLLYARKREEARISDALDQNGIVNVSIAEAAIVPALPTLHLGWLFAAGLFAGLTVSVGAAYAIDRIDPSFRTPDELGRYLDLRVLAAIPESTTRQ
jgi:uncharacterized protein involved in exopolysaccharide biosynthesis